MTMHQINRFIACSCGMEWMKPGSRSEPTTLFTSYLSFHNYTIWIVLMMLVSSVLSRWLSVHYWSRKALKDGSRKAKPLVDEHTPHSGSAGASALESG